MKQLPKVVGILVACILTSYMCWSFYMAISRNSGTPWVVVGFIPMVLLISLAGRNFADEHPEIYVATQLLLGSIILVTYLENSRSPVSSHAMLVAQFFAAVVLFVQVIGSCRSARRIRA
jgi:hypothetical protein